MTTTHANPTAKHGLLSLGVTLCVGLIWWFIPHPALGLALSLLPIAILFVLSQTFWLVTIFIVFSFFRIHEVFPVLYPLKFPLMLSAGALGALLWHTLVSQQVKLYWHRTYIWLIAFWGLVIIGVILAANRGVAIAMFNGTYWKIMVMTLAVSLAYHLSQRTVTILFLDGHIRITCRLRCPVQLR